MSRIDEVIVFRPLEENDFVSIARLMLSEYVDSLKEKGVQFTFQDSACQWLAHHAIGGKSGARDLRNLVRREVEDRITTAFIDAEDTQILGIDLFAEGDQFEKLMRYKNFLKRIKRICLTNGEFYGNI